MVVLQLDKDGSQLGAPQLVYTVGLCHLAGQERRLPMLAFEAYKQILTVTT